MPSFSIYILIAGKNPWVILDGTVDSRCSNGGGISIRIYDRRSAVVVWAAFGATTTWVCVLLAHACVLVILLALNRGTVFPVEGMVCRGSSAWPIAVLLVFIFFCALAALSGKNLSKCVLVCVTAFFKCADFQIPSIIRFENGGFCSLLSSKCADAVRAVDRSSCSPTICYRSTCWLCACNGWRVFMFGNSLGVSCSKNRCDPVIDRTDDGADVYAAHGLIRINLPPRSFATFQPKLALRGLC